MEISAGRGFGDFRIKNQGSKPPVPTKMEQSKNYKVYIDIAIGGKICKIFLTTAGG